MKEFKEEFFKIYDRLKVGKKFSFGKFADGEWEAICGRELNNNEFSSDSRTPPSCRARLTDALRYKHDDYYVGVCCSCCNGDRAKLMRDLSEQNIDNLTFANVFVNANYPFFRSLMIPEFSRHKIHLVAHESSNVKELPFEVEKFYPIKRNAWVENIDIVDEIISSKPSDKVFLFCCGPLGNILSHELHLSNKSNTYLDIGSTLNPWLKSEGFARDYYSMQSGFATKTCSWSI